MARAAPLPVSARPFDGLPFRRILLGAFVFGTIINLAMLSLPLYSLQVFTRAIPSASIETLVMLTVVVIVLLSMSSALEAVRARLLARAANGLDLAWRARLSAEVIDGAARGRADGSSLADLAEVKAALTRPSFTALLDLPWTPLYVVGIGLIHPVLAGVMLAAMAIFLGIGFLTHVLLAPEAEAAKRPSARAQRLFDALQTRAETARGGRMGPAVLDRVLTDAFAAASIQARSGEAGGTIATVSRWLRQLLQIGVTGLGAWLVIEHHLSFGGMIATSMLVGRGMAAIEQTAGGWTGLVASWRAWRRLRAATERLGLPAAARTAALQPERLVLENVLVVGPRDQKPVLRSVSFEVGPGEIACVLGLGQSGKTQLARVLAGITAPAAGTARLGGLALAAIEPRDPIVGIGYLPQSAELLPGTIAENIARFLPNGADGGDEDVIAAARRAGIHAWIEALPQGYRTEAADPSCPINGTPARLIALARAGFGRPVLVVLDEPAAGLDEPGLAAVRAFIPLVRERGATVVVLSHTGAFIDIADRSFVLQNGLVSAATPRALSPEPGHGRLRPLTASAVPAARAG